LRAFFAINKERFGTCEHLWVAVSRFPEVSTSNALSTVHTISKGYLPLASDGTPPVQYNCFLRWLYTSTYYGHFYHYLNDYYAQQPRSGAIDRTPDLRFTGRGF